MKCLPEHEKYWFPFEQWNTDGRVSPLLNLPFRNLASTWRYKHLRGKCHGSSQSNRQRNVREHWQPSWRILYTKTVEFLMHKECKRKNYDELFRLSGSKSSNMDPDSHASMYKTNFANCFLWYISNKVSRKGRACSSALGKASKPGAPWSTKLMKIWSDGPLEI